MVREICISQGVRERVAEVSPSGEIRPAFCASPAKSFAWISVSMRGRNRAHPVGRLRQRASCAVRQAQSGVDRVFSRDLLGCALRLTRRRDACRGRRGPCCGGRGRGHGRRRPGVRSLRASLHGGLLIGRRSGLRAKRARGQGKASEAAVRQPAQSTPPETGEVGRVSSRVSFGSIAADESVEPRG